MSQDSRRGANGSIYAYKTKGGTRYRIIFRDSRGQADEQERLPQPRGGTQARERLMGTVHRGEVRVSPESLEGYWLRYLQQRTGSAGRTRQPIRSASSTMIPSGPRT
jgi:hypothetical protein